MYGIICFLLVLFAIAGAALGWRKGTRDLKRPPERFDHPIGMSGREFARWLEKRYRRRRVLLTAGVTIGSAVGGFTLMLLASLQRWTR